MNKDINKRDEIIKPFATTEWGNDYTGGTLMFEYMPYKDLKKLVDEGFANKRNRHNEAPSTGWCIKFLEKHQNFTVGGYATKLDSKFYGVYIDRLDGISYWNSNEIKDFIDIAITSDEPIIHSIDYDPDEDYGKEGFIPGVICHAWWD